MSRPAFRPYNFETGSQPCPAFKPQQTGFGANRHECFGPYGPDGRIADAPHCHAWVSFCDHCSHDHHESGWNQCPVVHEPDRRPPVGRIR